MSYNRDLLLQFCRILSFSLNIFHNMDVLALFQEIEQPALIPHIAEANSLKYPYEVLFRSLQKLLMDTATSECVIHIMF